MPVRFMYGMNSRHRAAMKGAWTLSMQNESAARGACILAFDTANEVVAVGVGMYTEAPGGDPENPTFGMVPLACR